MCALICSGWKKTTEERHYHSVLRTWLPRLEKTGMSANTFHTLHNSSDITCDDMWNPLTCSWLMNDAAYLMVWEIASFFATLTSFLWWVFLASKIRNEHVALGKIVNFCISSGSRLVRRQLQQWYCVTLLKRSWCCILLFLWKCKCGDHIFFLVLGTVLICGSSISVFVPSLLKQCLQCVTCDFLSPVCHTAGKVWRACQPDAVGRSSTRPGWRWSLPLIKTINIFLQTECGCP